MEKRHQRSRERVPLPVEEWRPTPGAQVTQAISTRRAEREARYQQVENLHKQGLTSKEIARRIAISERTVRHWLHRGVAPDTRPRRKYPSAFDPYAPYVLTRWEEGERNGSHIWREIAAQGYPGSQRMLSRFLETLKTHEMGTAAASSAPAALQFDRGCFTVHASSRHVG